MKEKEIIDLDSLKGADELMDKVIKTCHDINDDAEMWRLIDEDHARRNIGAERAAVREKAHKEGLAEGKASEKIEIAKNLKQLGISLEDIVKATGLSKEQVESI